MNRTSGAHCIAAHLKSHTTENGQRNEKKKRVNDIQQLLPIDRINKQMKCKKDAFIFIVCASSQMAIIK